MYAFYGSSHRNLQQDDIDGVRSIYGSPVNFINGSNVICGSVPQTYSITEAVPSGYTVSWTANSTQVTLVPSGTNVTVTNNGLNGTVILTATISNGCGNLAFTKQIQVTNGTAPSPYSYTPYITIGGVTNYMNSYCNKLTYVCGANGSASTKGGGPDPNIFSLYSYCASGYITDPTVNSITWSVYQQSPVFHGSCIFTGNQFNVAINTNYPNDWVILRCTRTNSCGAAYDDYKFFVNGWSYGPPTYTKYNFITGQCVLAEIMCDGLV